MKRILFITTICFFGFSALASDLSIHVNPQSPYLIPVGAPINGGGTGPKAPYFNVNGITLTWSGNGAFELLAIMMTSKDQAVTCGGSGPAIGTMFVGAVLSDSPSGCSGNYSGGVYPIAGSAALDSDGNLSIPAVAVSGCTISVKSTAFYCDSLNIPVSSNPFMTYNIPVTVTAYGQDANGLKITASQDIIIQ